MTSPVLSRIGSTARSAAADARGAVAAALGSPTDAWTAADVPDQTGRTVLVTGGNAGLGLQVALGAARAGARVLLSARDAGRGELARARVAATATGPAPEVVPLDLADPASVRAAAADVAGRTDRLDVLVANAGLMMPPLTRTDAGLELQFATNVLGHYALTGLVLPQLLAAGQPRVVAVSSIAANGARVVLSDLQYQRRSYSAYGAYAQSKLAELLFVRELQRRADDAGRGLVAVAAHPGLSATGLFAGTALGKRAPRLAKVATRTIGTVGQDDAAGALPLLYAATVPGVRAGDFIGPSGPGEVRGAPTRVSMPAAASDEATAAALWLAAEDLSGVVYDWS